jgi:hypothetical protein
MIKRMFIVLCLFILLGCAGTQDVHTTTNIQIDKSQRYIVYPFRDPSFEEHEFPGVGSRFTNKFVAACANYGLNAIPIFTDKFQPNKDINILDALAYAKENGADFIITGQVTKWIDRATEWSSKRDFAGLEIFVREVTSGNIVFTTEMEEHSNMFWSGTPDDFVDSLSRAMAAKFTGTGR